jgi:hypothetical protein
LIIKIEKQEKQDYNSIDGRLSNNFLKMHKFIFSELKFKYNSSFDTVFICNGHVSFNATLLKCLIWNNKDVKGAEINCYNCKIEKLSYDWISKKNRQYISDCFSSGIIKNEKNSYFDGDRIQLIIIVLNKNKHTIFKYDNMDKLQNEEHLKKPVK